MTKQEVKGRYCVSGIRELNVMCYFLPVDIPKKSIRLSVCLSSRYFNKMLSYRRETTAQGALVLAKSGRMGLGYDILQTL